MDAQEREQLTDQKVFIDDLNQIRLVNPALLESSSKLSVEGKQFFGQFEQFLSAIRQVREAMEKIGHLTDRERMKLLSLQSQLDQRQKEETASEESRQIQTLISERQKELERLRVELNSLKEVEAQQTEYLLLCKKL